MDHFAIDDLLDFTKEEDEEFVSSELFLHSTESSSLADVEHYTPPVFTGQFTGDYSFSGAGDGDILVSCDDMEELEWLSNFVEESFSSNEIPLEFHLTNEQEQATPISNGVSHLLRPGAVVPARARRSKRSRAASCEWSSRTAVVERKELFAGDENDGGRRCMHCATEKTPQWRTGPMGAKTLCNACGVRFKSGRLVPEYRPAASPTFISTEHSNSHRKVVELRRQKEFENVRRRGSHVFSSSHSSGNSTLYSLSDGGGYLIHHHNGGSDYRHVFWAMA